MKVLCSFALVFVTVACSSGNLPPLTAAEYADAQDTVKKLQSVDAVPRHDCAAREAYIRPNAWAQLDAAAKQGVSIALAVTCATVGQTQPATITVIDNQSGKQLARVGALGYRLE